MGVLWNSTTPTHPRVLATLRKRLRAKGITLVSAPIRTADDFDGASSSYEGKANTVLRRPLSLKHTPPRTRRAGYQTSVADNVHQQGECRSRRAHELWPEFNDMYRYVAF